MVSTVSTYFKLFICFVLLCTFIQIGNTLPTFIDDDEDQTQLENPIFNSYALSGKVPFEDIYYHKKPFNSDNIQLGKRIIMLPRVGRRSIRST